MIYLKETPIDIPDLLNKFFAYSQRGMDATYIKGVETYFDPECTNIQCNQNRFRSFDDICECVNTYFPNTTDEDVFKALLDHKIVINGVIYSFCPLFCSGITKSVCCYMDTINAYFCFYWNHIGLSKYSWENLFNKIKITTVKEAREYILEGTEKFKESLKEVKKEIHENA